MSGLAAARALSDRGCDVEVVEARDRVGGRMHTVDGVDLGAHWIHGTEGNPITNLARRMSLPTLFVGGDTTYIGGLQHLALYTNGRPIAGDDKLRSTLIVDRLHDWIETLRRDHSVRDLSFAEAVDRFLHDNPSAPQLDPLVRWHIDVLARDDWSGGTNALSALHWDDGYEVYGYGDSVLLTGYQAMAEGLARGLNIRLSSPVRRIAHGPTGVTIQTDRHTLDCDYAIVTAPLGVLKAGNLAFDPPLPAAKTAAIDRLGFGTLTKLVMWYDEPFWPRDQYVFGAVGSAAPTLVVNLHFTHGTSCLVLLAGGDLGAAIETKSEADALAWGMAALREIFGPDIPRPSRIVRTSWLSDPYSRGSYSYVAVGATPADVETLAAPVGERLLFAGEATDRAHWACVHSAYLSGLREAARITGDTTILPARHFTENRRWRDRLLRLSRFLDLRSGELGRDRIDERCQVLASAEAFKTVPVHEMSLLASMFEERQLAEGEVLCRFGDAAGEVYVIAAGSLAIRSDDGGHIRSCGIGEVVGEYGLFTSMSRRQATVVAECESRVLALDYDRFSHFLNAFPRAMQELMRVAVSRLAELERAQRD